MSSAPNDPHHAPQHLADAWNLLKQQDMADAEAARIPGHKHALKQTAARDPKFIALKTALQAKPASDIRDAILQRLDDGLYGDFTSEIAFPKMTLAEHLSLAGFADLERRTCDGDFDF